MKTTKTQKTTRNENVPMSLTEIQQMVEKLNAEIGSDYYACYCTPAWSLNIHVKISTYQHPGTLWAIDYSGFKDQYSYFNEDQYQRGDDVRAVDLYDYLKKTWIDEEERRARWQKNHDREIEIKKSLAKGDDAIYVDKVEHETEKAVAIKDGNKFIWLPKSQIRVIDENHIVMPTWLMRKNNLEFYSITF